MALAELGYKYPCRIEGEPIALEAVAAQPGDILEFYGVPDREITPHDAARIAFEVAKIKESYPDTVIHYLKIDPWRVTAQYSVSPPSSKVALLPHVPWWVIVAVIWAIVVGIIVINAEKVGYLLRGKPPMGNLQLNAEDAITHKALYVPFNVAGKSGTTPALITDLTPGTYKVTWGYITDYQTPPATNVTVVADQTVSKTAKYYPEGVTPPATGWIIVDTSPVKGMVYIDAVEIAKAPIQCEVDVGAHVVSFGDIGGYETPPAQTWDIAPGDEIAVIGTYERIGWPTWAKVTAGAGVIALFTLILRDVLRR